MNTLLIATDFSPASENAMHYGSSLAQLLKAPIVLTHIYQTVVSMNDLPVMAYSADELRKSAESGLERCRLELQKNHPGLSIKTESRLGSIPEELSQLATETNAFAIVMGSSPVKGLERILFGSTATSVIRHVHCPVFAVPETKMFSLNNIVLAADLEDIPGKLSSKIIKVVQQLGRSLHIVHVKTKEETERPDVLLEKLSVLSPSYETVGHKNVKEGLQSYVEKVNADLIILLPHEHNFADRLFFKVHTDDIITSMQIPVLAIKC